MRNMVLRFTILLVLCSVVWNVGAESEVRVDRPTIATLLTKGDTPEIERIIARLEQNWSITSDPAYFENMSVICQEMASQVIRNKDWFPKLLNCSSLLFEKNETVKDSERCIMYVNQAEVIHRLLDLLTNKVIWDDPLWNQSRSKVFRLVATYYSRMQKRYIPNFRPHNIVMNVMPPAGSGADAGADPRSIKDPEAKADYEAAIHENSRKGAINREQRCLEDIMQNELPRWEVSIIEAYSREPLNYEELGEYLHGFGSQERYHIITGVVKATGKAAPVDFLPPQ